MKFALALHTDDGIKYGVTVPDLPGCFSGGDTLDEAIEMGKEAIDAHYELLVEKGMEIPKPRPISEHKADPDLADAIWAIVEVDVEKYQTGRRPEHVRAAAEKSAPLSDTPEGYDS